MDNNFKIDGVSPLLSNMILNTYFLSICKDEEERELLEAALTIYNKYGVPSHKVTQMLNELSEAHKTIQEKYNT